MNSNYYHLTNPLVIAAIMQKGLKSSGDGYIYLLDSKEIADYVALNQLFLMEYALLEINPDGFEAELEQDKVGEITAKHQFRIKQALIKSKYIKLRGVFSFKINAK